MALATMIMFIYVFIVVLIIGWCSKNWRHLLSSEGQGDRNSPRPHSELSSERQGDPISPRLFFELLQFVFAIIGVGLGLLSIL